ncbi:MAG: hypothetical protein HZA64_05755 [Rhodocyclales bacterium]|nr:hypothetical protein [Rhodocyclales bacterium]
MAINSVRLPTLNAKAVARFPLLPWLLVGSASLAVALGLVVRRYPPSFWLDQPAAVANSGFCAGMVTDKLPHPMSSVPKPAMGVPFVDPAFGTRVIRITDVQAETGFVGGRVPMYSTVPAWNADESYLIVFQTHAYSQSGLRSRHLLYDGKTYQFIRELDIGPADVEHVYWDSKDPDVLYYPFTYEASGRPIRQLVKYHVGSGQREVLENFACPGTLDFGHPKYMAWDGSRIGMRCRGRYPAAETFVFDLLASRESPRINSPRDIGIQVAPSGKLGMFGSSVIDLSSMTPVRTLKTNPWEHGTLVPTAGGQDAFVSVQFDGNYIGTLMLENLQTGGVREIIGKKTGWRSYPPVTTHISTTAFQARGWVAVSIEGEHAGRNVLDQELVIANVDTGEVCRAAHHHSRSTSGPRGYWAEPHVVISPTGTRLMFGSDWGGGTTVDTYIVELPGYTKGRSRATAK